MNAPSITTVISLLDSAYGAVDPPPATGPLELIIWENIAYMADDEHRGRAFDLLKATAGLEPAQLLAADDDQLLSVAKHGIVAEQTVEKLRKIASLMMEEFPNGLEPVLKLPPKQAKRELRKFPMVGEPAAAKILLFTGAAPELCFESNGLRVVERLGYFKATGRYDADYKAAKQALIPDAPSDIPWLTSAHLLLRRHGQITCRRNAPKCNACPLRSICPYPPSA